MAEVVLDSSAILAVFNQEPGAAVAKPLLYRAHVSTLIAAEVASKLVARGMSPDSARSSLLALEFHIHPFTFADALLTAALCGQRSGRSVSLADRACLVLGISLNLPVVTADRAWKTVDLGRSIDLRFIR